MPPLEREELVARGGVPDLQTVHRRRHPRDGRRARWWGARPDAMMTFPYIALPTRRPVYSLGGAPWSAIALWSRSRCVGHPGRDPSPRPWTAAPMTRPCPPTLPRNWGSAWLNLRRAPAKQERRTVRGPQNDQTRLNLTSCQFRHRVYRHESTRGRGSRAKAAGAAQRRDQDASVLERGTRGGWVPVAQLQEGDSLGMPHSRPMPSIGPRCHEIRVRDENRIWRVVYRLDPDAILIAGVFSKTTRATSKHDIDDLPETAEGLRRSGAESREASGA